MTETPRMTLTSFHRTTLSTEQQLNSKQRPITAAKRPPVKIARARDVRLGPHQLQCQSVDSLTFSRSLSVSHVHPRFSSPIRHRSSTERIA